MSDLPHYPPIKVAIIGAGPAGLAAAIELAKLPFVDWQLYEKKSEVSEISTGLSLQRNTWRTLEHFGVARHLSATQFFRPVNGHTTQHRNGRTGELIATGDVRTVPPHQEPCRIHRAILQQALLKEVDQARVHANTKLVQIEVQRKEKSPEKLRLLFEGSPPQEVDLLVGADGIRSIVRTTAFPSHSISYTGATAYRAVVNAADALSINGIPPEVVFWHGPGNSYVYTCPLGNNYEKSDFEVGCKFLEGEAGQQSERGSWGRSAETETVLKRIREYGYAPPVVQLVETFVKGKDNSFRQYDFFAGPRLERVIGSGDFSRIALIGDASHPLSGAFGAGAAFAFEDVYALASALEWAYKNKPVDHFVQEALDLFDRVRTPHYKDLYGVIDGFVQGEKNIAPELLPDDEIKQRIESSWNDKSEWIYHYEVDKVFAKVVAESEPTKHKL